MVFKNIPKTEGFVLLSFLIYSIFLYLQCTNYTPIVLPPKIVYVDKPVYIPVKQIVTTPTQVKCMAEAIYFEGRNQSDTGEKAIAHVIVNRVTSGVFPKTICGVVHDGCQFSYSCSHRIKKIKEPEEYKRALDISNAVISGERDFTYNAMFYHAKYVHPKWAHKMQIAANIGDHIFYKEN